MLSVRAVCGVVFVLSLAACSGRPMGEGAIAGRFAAEASASGTMASAPARVIDSPETSLSGLSVTLEVWRVPPNTGEDEYDEALAFDEVIGVEIPDAAGRFAFDAIPGVPLEQLHPSWGGNFFVRIEQEDETGVEYGEGAAINYVWDGETLPMSIPLATRFELPDWFESSANPAMAPLITAHDDRNLLVYVNPELGLAVFDPVGSTVRAAHFPDAFDYGVHASQLHVLEVADLAIITLLHDNATMPSDSARFLWVDLEPLLGLDESAVVYPEAPDAPEAVAAMLQVVDVLPGDAPDLSPWRIMEGEGDFAPSSHHTAGGRFYNGRWGSTFVLDVDTRSFVEAYHDNGILGAYNADLDHLYFDLPGGLLRVREGSTGATVADVDLGAARLLGAVGVPGERRTLVSYASADRPLEHRIAFLGEQGEVLSDELGGDVLGFAERNWDPRYEWGTCSSFFFRTPDCPDCATEPPSDIYPPHTAGTPLHTLDYTFDEARGQLVVGTYGYRFAYEAGEFHPMPSPGCLHFPALSSSDDCEGLPIYDRRSAATVIMAREAVCVMHLDEPDLTVPVRVDRTQSLQTGFSPPAVLSNIGTAYVPGRFGVTAIHYRNADAASLPAVRDLTGVYKGRRSGLDARHAQVAAARRRDGHARG